MTGRLSPVKAASLVDQVYGQLRRSILSGEFAPGEELRQEVLAHDLGISRTPLREALNRLAADGLIEFRPHRSAIVAEFSEHDIEMDYQARRILESAAARLAATRRDPENLASLAAALDAAEAAGDDVERQFEASKEFHRALVEASGNPQLVRFSEELWGGPMAPFIYARQAKQVDRHDRDRNDHERILKYVANGEADAAAQAVDEHLAAAFDSLRADAST